MRNRTGAVISIAACLLLFVLLAWPYTVKSAPDVNTYYGWGVLTPLLPGVLAVGVLLTFAAMRENYVSPELGAGVALGLALFTFLTSLVWAATARVDVFRAPGWALPAQRFVLVGLSALVVAGAGWHALSNGLLAARR